MIVNYSLDQSFYSYSEHDQEVLFSGELFGKDKSETQENVIQVNSIKNVEKTYICKSDCIIMTINMEIFDILHRKHVMKYRYNLAEFLSTILPQFLKFYSIHKIMDTAHQIFKKCSFLKDQTVIKQGEAGDKFFVISKGQVSLTKKIEYLNNFGKKVTRKITLLQLHQGDIFGQEIVSLIKKNQPGDSVEKKLANKFWKMLTPSIKFYLCSAVVTSINGVELFEVTSQNFQRFYQPMTKHVIHMSRDRQRFLEKSEERLIKSLQERENEPSESHDSPRQILHRQKYKRRNETETRSDYVSYNQSKLSSEQF